MSLLDRFEQPHRITIHPFYRDHDFRLIAIHRGTKGPANKNWPDSQTKASDIEHKLNGQEYNKYGWVIPDGILVIDIDNHSEEKNGDESFGRLSDAISDELLIARCGAVVASPSGGYHLYFRVPPGWRPHWPTGGKHEYPGIDLLSKGRQVICAGSCHDQHPGELYKFQQQDPEINTLPEELLNYWSPIPKGDPSRPPVDRSEFAASDIEEVRQCLGWLRLNVQGIADDYEDWVRFGLACKYLGDELFDAWDAWSATSEAYPGSEECRRKWDSLEPNGTLTHKLIFHIAHGAGWTSGVHRASPEQVFSKVAQAESELEQEAAGDEQRTNEGTKGTNEGTNRRRTGDEQATDSLIEPAMKLMFDHPELHEEVILGLARSGEVINVIAAPKTGKSWLVLDLAISVANGMDFLGHPTRQGKVLMFDNELHPATLSNRLKVVSRLMGAEIHNIDVMSVRGRLISVSTLADHIKPIIAGGYSLIIMDAMYKMWDPATSENSNADVSAFYSKIDTYAAASGATIALVHHTSKGEQGDRDMTDVGAGAGAISRAADTHITIRQHKDEGLNVMDVVCRSMPSPEPRTIELVWPMWKQRPDVAPELATADAKKQEKREKSADAGVLKMLQQGPLSITALMERSSMGRPRISAAVFRLVDAGKVDSREKEYRGRTFTEFYLL